MTTTATPYGRARAFLRDNARILEQRLAETLFDEADPAPVVAAVGAYRNPDGGFGHSLEPDSRCPTSQPLYAEIALEALRTAGVAPDQAMLASLCDHLASVAAPGGAVPLMLPGFAAYPRATHWQGVDELPPDLNPTAALAGLLHGFGVNHPWLDEATAWCLDSLEADGLPTEAHALRCVLTLLETVPDQQRAERIAGGLAGVLPGTAFYRADPDDSEYGVTPLDLAPEPASPWRKLFTDDLIAAHLDALAAEQQPDGGWLIRWEPPTEPSTWEWRGMVTLRAVATLVADGRLPTA
jgi:hypothetical protein